ncbi:MAG: acyl-CoA dehydrogenase family protein [Pseudomonadales bacterium]
MDLAYTDEQNMLRESIEKFLASEYDLTARQKLVSSETGFSGQHWQTYADLGWLGLPIAEDFGGLGGDLVDTMIMFEAFGKGLVVEPVLSTLVLFAGALDIGGSEDQKQAYLPSIASGEVQGALAYLEAAAPTDLHVVETTAVSVDTNYTITGTKSVVLHAASADHFLVSARTSGSADDPAGISLFLVPADSDGVSRKDYPTVDGLRASELVFDQVKVPQTACVGNLGEGLTLLQRVINRGILAISAEAVGAMQVLYESTIEYTKQREQFDHPLADFQVVKHRLTEMFIEYNLAKSLCMKATMLENQRTDDAQRHIHALKFLVGKSSRFVGQNAVQLHGGMGMTEDLAVAHYFKRLMMIDATFGHTDIHLQAFVG